MQLHYLPQLQAAKAAGAPFKALLFLAPTNPLVAQVGAGSTHNKLRLLWCVVCSNALLSLA
jgi:hypothetical protein